MKQQKIVRDIPKKPVTVLDNRIPKALPDIVVDPQYANKPVRTVNYVEVGDMEAKQIQFIIQQLNATYDSAKGGIHYFVPVRHGKIGADIVFEEEFEKVGNDIFEVVDKDNNIIEDAKIRLKGGAKEVAIVRRNV